jgi:poly(3-hydroxybutyrate) depolymerase
VEEARSSTGPRRARRRLAVLVCALAVVLAGLTAGQAAQAAPAPNGALPRLSATGGDYVTGISSGGYMATQLQVAYSHRIRAAGIFSAGPYWCAQDSLVLALESCTSAVVPPDLPAAYRQTDRYEREGKIDPTANLAHMPTYFFHGTRDQTVVQTVADDLATYYEHYGVPLTYRSDLAAGHGWISALGPVACGDTASPYVNNCPGYDAEAELLRTMTGAVNPPAATPRGTVTAFSQDPYAVAPQLGAGDLTRRGAPAIGMGSTGYLYTPANCARGGRCAVVVALHGCQQTAEQLGTTFVEKSNLNAYADTNSFVVLYPQARPDYAFGNPKGCWDWWGYLGWNDGDYATKLGPQMRTVMNMVTALGG